MIEVSSSVLAQECQNVWLFLPKQFLKKNNIEQNTKKIKNLFIKKISFLERKFMYFDFLAKRIKNYIYKSDIIILHNAKLLKPLRSHFPKKKIILFFHTDKNSQIKSFKYADKVLAVNKTMTNYINRWYSDKAIYLPNCLNYNYEKKNYIKSKRSPKNKSSKKIVVGAMGRLVKKKGFDFLIETFLEIPEIELLLAGSGKEYKSLKKKALENKNIKLPGWISDKESFFKKIDIFCNCSVKEPFGLVLIEAMARGVPVISTNCNGPLDIIKDYTNGLIIERNNKLELKNAIYKLKNDTRLRKKLAINGQKTFFKNFTLEKYKNNIKKIFINI